ncbi:uncharacterized protein [Musca autumnalis]|uniref:uncharacterized protein n=1 Tax=Musca autumnalis TaxID=221902 RepID=UPI003CF55235
MPKMPKNENIKIKWIRDVDNRIFKLDGDEIFCTICNKQIVCYRKSQLHQHMATKTHTKLAAELLGIATSVAEYEGDFNSDLCQTLIEGNIPWNVVNDPSFRTFLEKYTKNTMPDESCLRMIYLRNFYYRKLNQMQGELNNHHIWICVDLTTNMTGCNIANFIVGKLENNDMSNPSSPPYLFAAKELTNVNGSSITQFVNESISLLGSQHEKILLLVTNGAPYMLEAGIDLKMQYPDLLHITCLADKLNHLAEPISFAFPLVNDFINCVQQLLTKAPYRVGYYKSTLNLELPPEPVINKTSSWIKTAVFHVDNFESIKKVIQAFNPEDCDAIKHAQQLMENDQLFYDLLYIKSNFEQLYLIIERLEDNPSSLKESIKLFNDAEQIVRDIAGDLGNSMRDKLGEILQRNSDLMTLMNLNNILNYNHIGNCDVGNVKRKNIIKYKFAPMTLFDVEKSFPGYKKVIVENSPNMPIYDLEKILITYCNDNYSL